MTDDLAVHPHSTARSSTTWNYITFYPLRVDFSVHPLSTVGSSTTTWNLVLLILKVKLVIVSQLQKTKQSKLDYSELKKRSMGHNAHLSESQCSIKK